jgi:hypothetical protein
MLVFWTAHKLKFCLNYDADLKIAFINCRTYALTGNTKYVLLVKSLVGGVRCKKSVHYCQIIESDAPY